MANDDLDSTTENFLGLPGIARAAALTPGIVGSGSVSSTQRGILEGNLLDSTLDILEKSNRMALLIRAEKGRQAGNNVIGEISKLDPSQPDYLERRNKIIASAPFATLDDVATRFLGLQEDVFNVAETARRRRQAVLEGESVYESRLDTQIQKNEEREKRYRERQIIDAVRGMSSGAQLIYKDAISKKKSPEDSLQEAVAFEEDQNLQTQLLQAGLEEEELDKIRGEDGQIDKRKAATFFGGKEREKEGQRQLQGIVSGLEEELKVLDKIVADPLTPTLEREEAKKEARALRAKVRELKFGSKDWKARLGIEVEGAESSGFDPFAGTPGFIE